MTETSTNDGVAGVEIKVSGTALDPIVAHQVTEVRVQDNLALPDAFLIKISDPDLKLMDNSMFEIGNDVEILFADHISGGLTTVCRGQIAALEPEFAQGGAYVVLRGYDRSHAMYRTHRTQTYQNSTADDIARKIATRIGLTPGTIDPAGAPQDFHQQTNETDWDFLRRLASKIDFEVLVDGETLHFRKAGSAPDGDPILLRWGDALIAFRPRVTGVQQVDGVVVRGWDPRSKSAIEATAQPARLGSSIGIDRDRVASALGGGTATIADRPIETQAEADALAHSLAAHLGNAFVEAEGATHGDPRLRAGTRVQIEGVGNRFTGTYSLSSTTHVYRGSRGYETHFSISGRAPRGLVNLATPAAKRSWSDSVVIGVVSQNQDPDGLGRVRVKYPALGDSTEGWWARVATPSAGAGRGMMMMPVVGDEVLIAFEHGDARRPIVLGSLFNGRGKPKDLSQSDGSFALGSGKAVAITAADAITIKSGTGLQITSGAAMQVNAKGLTETVQGDTKLTASGSVTVEAGSSLTVSSSASLTIKAPNITLQASGVVEISGSQVKLG